MQNLASIGKDANGHKRILFVATDGKKKTVRWNTRSFSVRWFGAKRTNHMPKRGFRNDSTLSLRNQTWRKALVSKSGTWRVRRSLCNSSSMCVCGRVGQHRRLSRTKDYSVGIEDLNSNCRFSSTLPSKTTLSRPHNAAPAHRNTTLTDYLRIAHAANMGRFRGVPFFEPHRHRSQDLLHHFYTICMKSGANQWNEILLHKLQTDLQWKRKQLVLPCDCSLTFSTYFAC